jgi:hypothetical protein
MPLPVLEFSKNILESSVSSILRYSVMLAALAAGRLLIAIFWSDFVDNRHRSCQADIPRLDRC